uniref:UTP14A small subunit processome component n=1 Tax=Varanus komodoensis TaxID=61221 RepID=A0A8D2Q449_VARKO
AFPLHSQTDGSLSCRQRTVERTEASGHISEFSVGGAGTGEKVLLSELLQPISASPALRPIRKQLNKAQQKKATELPLSKTESERVVREAAYTQTSQALAKWDPVVQQNRQAEQLIFPLQQAGVAAAPVEEVISAWQARTPLEQEIFSLLHKAHQPVKDPLLTPQEKASLQAMSLEEAQMRRRELQRARAVQSYYEAKARRERKIKSKRYHKVLRKGKSRKVLQEFEALRKCNPEAALEQLEKVEKARVEERMSLKHQNKGRWAKSTVIMAKYDLEARKAMQEQLARNKELTQKVHLASDNEEAGNGSEEEEGLIPDVVNEGQAGMHLDNPWMLGKRPTEAEKDLPAPPESSEESEGEGPPVSTEEALLQGFSERRQGLQSLQDSAELEAGCWAFPLSREPLLTWMRTADLATGPNEEETLPLLLPGPLPPAPLSPVPEGPLLSETLARLRTPGDLEALEAEDVLQEGKVPPLEDAELQQPAGAVPSPQAQGSRPAAPKKAAKRKALADLKAHFAEAPLVWSLVDLVPHFLLEMSTDQRQVIQEAFASDNVVADFMKEKRQAEEAGKPKAIDLVLPGWGEWGGAGLRPSLKKRKRFIIKPAPGPQRKDRHLPHVILSEQRNILAAAHQVNQLPFPFENSKQFERSIQAPVGSTWNTQRAFQRLTAPRVVTKPGHIIRPITAEDANLTRQRNGTKDMREKPDLELTLPPAKHPTRRTSKKKAR